MYFTSGQDRAFERLMQEKPGFDHYDGGGANAPEDCGSCHFYRPDWKYQYCVYAECPYQPGKLTALATVKFTVKGADDDMAVFRVEKNKGYTVMSNHHLRNKALSLKAKGLLSQMLSLPENWDYTLKGCPLSTGKASTLSGRRCGSWNGPDISGGSRAVTQRAKWPIWSIPFTSSRCWISRYWKTRCWKSQHRITRHRIIRRREIQRN